MFTASTRVRHATAAVLLWLAGCGASTGLPVTGVVHLDGAPLPWGQVYLHGEVDNTGDTHHAVYEVRDGRFASSAGVGLEPGEYQVTVFVHDGAAPAAPMEVVAEGPSAEANVVGEWHGTAQVAPEVELKFDLTRGELKKPS